MPDDRIVIRRLTSLYETPTKHSNRYFASFAYYERGNDGNLQWTGESESCEFTVAELYEFLKPKLKKESMGR